MDWFYSDGQQPFGPVPDAELDRLVERGVVTPQTLVWRTGMVTWTAYASVADERVPVVPAFNSDGQAGLATGAAVQPAPVIQTFCTECGTPHAPDDLLAIGPARICANCKDRYVQRLREGALPGGLARHREYGGFWIRVLASIIDAVVLWILNFTIQIPYTMFITLVLRDRLLMLYTSMGLLYLFQLALACVFRSWFIVNKGGTPGKLICSLEVIRADGTRPGWGVAVGRYFAEWLSAIILGFGYIMVGLDEEKRALHDRICDTRVIRR